MLFTATARRLDIVSAVTTVVLLVAHAVTLVVGLASLKSPARQPWLPLIMSFQWPSVAYALDVLGWDVFFALSMLFAAPVLGGSRLAGWIRGLMIASGVLALAGWSGVAAGDMQLRTIGILGYVGVFLVVAALLAVLFRATPPEDRATPSARRGEA